MTKAEHLAWAIFSPPAGVVSRVIAVIAEEASHGLIIELLAGQPVSYETLARLGHALGSLEIVVVPVDDGSLSIGIAGIASHLFDEGP